MTFVRAAFNIDNITLSVVKKVEGVNYFGITLSMFSMLF